MGEARAAGGHVAPDRDLAGGAERDHRVVGLRVVGLEVDGARRRQDAARRIEAEITQFRLLHYRQDEGHRACVGGHAAKAAHRERARGVGLEGRAARGPDRVTRVGQPAGRQAEELSGRGRPHCPRRPGVVREGGCPRRDRVVGGVVRAQGRAGRIGSREKQRLQGGRGERRAKRRPEVPVGIVDGRAEIGPGVGGPAPRQGPQDRPAAVLEGEPPGRQIRRRDQARHRKVGRDPGLGGGERGADHEYAGTLDGVRDVRREDDQGDRVQSRGVPGLEPGLVGAHEVLSRSPRPELDGLLAQVAGDAADRLLDLHQVEGSESGRGNQQDGEA